MLSDKAKSIKQVPEGYNCTIKGYRKLIDNVRPEFIDCFKEYTDKNITDMIRNENRLARRRY